MKVQPKSWYSCYTNRLSDTKWCLDIHDIAQMGNADFNLRAECCGAHPIIKPIRDLADAKVPTRSTITGWPMTPSLALPFPGKPQ